MPQRSTSPHPRSKSSTVLYCLAIGSLCFAAGRYSKSELKTPIAASDSNSRIAASAISSTSPAPNDLVSASSLDAKWDESRWHELKTKPASPANTLARAALLEKLAVSAPQQSLALAQAEPNLMLRETFLQAVLRGWAQSSPIDAAHHALALTSPSSREAGLNSVFAGAVAADPQEAIRAGQRLFAENPAEAVGLGSHLIDALCQAGNFQSAAELSLTAAAGNRAFWMGNAFSKWASFQPQQAAEAAAALSDPDLRNQALHGVVGGWSMADPSSLVQYVAQLPNTTDRASLISQALQRWAKTNPVAASDWINNHEGGPEMDQGVASVATMEALKPDVAVGWAESITSAKLRSETLVSVLRNWATNDLAATKNYFEKSKDLLPEDREEIGGVIKTLSGQTASP